MSLRPDKEPLRAVREIPPQKVRCARCGLDHAIPPARRVAGLAILLPSLGLGCAAMFWTMHVILGRVPGRLGLALCIAASAVPIALGVGFSQAMGILGGPPNRCSQCRARL